MNVVRAGVAQLELVAPLFDAYRQFYACSANLELATTFLKDRLDRGESVVFVAREGDRGLGFTQLYPIFTSIGARRAYILNDLYVVPAARRRGIGRALVVAARAFAEEGGAAWLELATAGDNHAARALYQSLGFRREEKFERYKLTLA